MTNSCFRKVVRWRGKPSHYIKHFKDVGECKVILCLRVSRPGQREHLRDQEECLRRMVAKAGGTVVGKVEKIRLGSRPKWLAKAANLARRLDAILLAESTCRFIRSKEYSPLEQAQPMDLAKLKSVTGDVPLMTVVHPDASPAEVRSYQSRRGQQEKNNRGGRPAKRQPGYKKRQRRANMADVLELVCAGYSQSEIARKLNLHRTQVRRYIVRIGAGEKLTHFLVRTKWFREFFLKKYGRKALSTTAG